MAAAPLAGAGIGPAVLDGVVAISHRDPATATVDTDGDTAAFVVEVRPRGSGSESYGRVPDLALSVVHPEVDANRREDTRLLTRDFPGETIQQADARQSFVDDVAAVVAASDAAPLTDADRDAFAAVLADVADRHRTGKLVGLSEPAAYVLDHTATVEYDAGYNSKWTVEIQPPGDPGAELSLSPENWSGQSPPAGLGSRSAYSSSEARRQLDNAMQSPHVWRILRDLWTQVAAEQIRQNGATDDDTDRDAEGEVVA